VTDFPTSPVQRHTLVNPTASRTKGRGRPAPAGDLGTVDADGYISFVGRKDETIISAGYRISPYEIEDTLAGHDAVGEVAIVGVPDEERGEVPKAFVVLTVGTEPSANLRERLQNFVKERLAAYEHP